MRKLLPRVNPHRSVHILFLVLCLLFGTQVLAQSTVQVQGTIIDSTGEPLPGVNVVIKGTAVGTVSDLDGKYTLNVPQTLCLYFRLSDLSVRKSR